MTESPAVPRGIMNRRVIQVIAYVTMMIDHLAASLSITWWNVHASRTGYMLYEVMRGIGRMAFPLFIFCLVNGVRHTRNKIMYLVRVAVFAVISEVPFDLALFGKVWEPRYQNVMLTLFIGLCVLLVIQWTMHQKGQKLVLGIFATVVAVPMGILLADALHTDYGMGGAFAIIVMGFALLNPLTEKVTNYPWINLIRAGAMALVVLILGLKCGTSEFLAMLMVVPVFLYQDTPAVPKRRHLFRSNYLIYPAHLALYALAIVLPYLLSKGKPLF